MFGCCQASSDVPLSSCIDVGDLVRCFRVLKYSDKDILDVLYFSRACEVDMEKFIAEVFEKEAPACNAELQTRVVQEAMPFASELDEIIPPRLVERITKRAEVQKNPSLRDRDPKRSQTSPIPFRNPGSNRLQAVQASELAWPELAKKLKDYMPKSHPDNEVSQKTVSKVAELLRKGEGGAIVALVEGHLWDSISFDHLDGGHLTDLFKAVAPSVHDQRTGNISATFKHVFTKFAAHSHSDRWGEEDLADLRFSLKEQQKDADEYVRLLQGMPKDGAVVISLKGHVMGAAGHLKYSSAKWQLQKPDGTFAGTRHNSSLAFAEWIGTRPGEEPGGSVAYIFIRSDDGGVHVIVPQSAAEPLVYHFENVRPASQKEMLELFREKIKSAGNLMIKSSSAFARRGKKGERIVTWTGDHVISDTIIRDDTSWVMRSASTDHECYVLSDDKFKRNWTTPGQDLTGDDDEAVELRRRGYKSHKPEAKSSKWFYQLVEEDLKMLDDRNLARCMTTPFGSHPQPLMVNDYLALSFHEKGIYLMPLHVLKLYKDVDAAVQRTLSGAPTPASCMLTPQ